MNKLRMTAEHPNGPESPPLLEDSETSTMLTPSEVLSHVYCPRFTYFRTVHGISEHEEKRYKVQKGREVHERREKENTEYLRRKLGVVKRAVGVYLASRSVRVRGAVDEVLWLEDGTLAPLDYKYTSDPGQVYRTHRVQLTLYALLIESVYQATVNRGFVAYVRDGSTVHEVPMGPQERLEAKRLVEEVFDVIQTGRLPPRTRDRAKCPDCTYRNLCV